MKILLIGSEGMLGKELEEILGNNFELVSLGRSDLDIADAKAIEKVFAENDFDICVNAAAYTAVDKAEENITTADIVNGEAVGNLAKNCEKSAVKLIHFSTDYVFDGKNPKGYAENAATKPINAYGKSKLFGEELIQKSNCKFAIIRVSWLFGDGGNFVKTMLHLSENNPEIKVVSDQIGKPTYTRDLAEATLDLIENSEEGIFHLTNEGSVSWSDFAKKIFEMKEIEVKVIPIPSSEFPTLAARPKNSILLNTKLPKLRSWEEALREYLR
jgi:dTDP-4-dehydrorhamnose reductase